MSCVFLGAEMWKFFHLQTRCSLQFLTPKQLPTLVAGFPFPSWLKFADSFSFHFSKLPRQNFLRKFRHLRLLRSSQLQGNFCERSLLWKQSTLVKFTLSLSKCSRHKSYRQNLIIFYLALFIWLSQIPYLCICNGKTRTSTTHLFGQREKSESTN